MKKIGGDVKKMKKEKIKIREGTFADFERNGSSFAQCANCGWLIVVEDRPGTKHLIETIVEEFKGLAFDKVCLYIASKLSKCCSKPDFQWMFPYMTKDQEKNFQILKQKFQEQFQ